MKRYLVLLVAACSLIMTAPATARKTYGEVFKAQAAQTPEQLMAKLQQQPTIKGVTVQGQIAQVCQAQGCWLKLKNPSGQDMMVMFKDHSFFVPKDIAGKNTIVYGTAMKKTITVAEQRHLAEDAGMSAAEIAKITTPKAEVRIEASGVVVD